MNSIQLRDPYEIPLYVVSVQSLPEGIQNDAATLTP